MPDISLKRVDSGGGEPRLNVIFVHGLGGDPVTTWCHKGGENDGYFWLKDIAEEIEGVAVYTLGYPGDKAAWNDGWPIAEAAVAVLDKLMTSRVLSRNGRIAFVCHSLGGIIIKKLVVTAHLDRGQQPGKGRFLDRIAGVVFLATPHDGSIIASVAETARWFVSKSVGDLAASDAALLELGHFYLDRLANEEAVIRHRVYYEKLGMWGAKVVTAASANPGLPGSYPVPVNRDHENICKPPKNKDLVYDDPVYEGVVAFLRDDVLQPREMNQNEKLDRVLALLDESGETARAAAAGLRRQAIVELARTQAVLESARRQVVLLMPAEAIDFVAQELREFRHLVSIAAEVISKGQRATNERAFVGEVLKRVAEMTKEGNFDGGTKAVDDALAEFTRLDLERRQTLQTSQKALLEAGVKQDLLRHDPFAVARRVEAIAALEATGGNPVWSQKYRERFDTFYAEGQEKGINLSLEVAIEMARRMVASAANGDQRGIALSLLGKALRALGEREGGTARLEQAVAAFHDALKEQTREGAPFDWAMTQNNLGNALHRLGERESRTARLEEAVAVYSEALQEWTHEHAPLQWAMTQNNLGLALRVLGERENGTARLEEAVAAHRGALQENTRARVPLDWAAIQNNLGMALGALGMALMALGKQEAGTARLEEAVAAFREALQENTRARVPLEWAATKVNLGLALGTLGEGESGTARLEEAVAAYREALQEYTRARAPLQWAMTQENLAEAHLAFFAKDRQQRHLDDAVEAVDGALEEYRKAKADFHIDRAERLREKILAAKANSTPPRPAVTK